MSLKLFPKVPFKASQMVMMSQSELALVPTLTLKVVVKIRLGQNLPFNSITNFYSYTVLKSAIQGLPDGQDGQVGAGHGSHVVPEGPDQL